jgi:hypothetical protein
MSIDHDSSPRLLGLIKGFVEVIFRKVLFTPEDQATE